MKQAVK